MSASGGLWIQSSASDNDIFTDSKQYDGVIRTETLSSRILFGFSNNNDSAVAISTDAVGGHAMSVAGKLLVGHPASSVIDVAQAIRNISLGTGLAPGSVTTAALSNRSVTADKIAGVVPVAVGGTGNNAFPPRAVPFAALAVDGGAQVLTHKAASFAFDSNADKLLLSNAEVAGDLLVASRAVGGGAPVNVAVAIEDLRKAGITPGGVGTTALADGCVTTAKIAAGAVTPAKISGVLPATVGGTGVSALPSNAVPYGSVAAGGIQVLGADASRLSFDPATATLTASNASVPGRLHAFTDIVAGKPGGVRFRLTVDGGELVMTKISAAGVESPYINFKDLKAIVDNIAVVP
jgi:hypothetical protein